MTMIQEKWNDIPNSECGSAFPKQMGSLSLLAVGFMSALCVMLLLKAKNACRGPIRSFGEVGFVAFGRWGQVVVCSMDTFFL